MKCQTRQSRGFQRHACSGRSAAGGLGPEPTGILRSVPPRSALTSWARLPAAGATRGIPATEAARQVWAGPLFVLLLGIQREKPFGNRAPQPPPSVVPPPPHTHTVQFGSWETVKVQTRNRSGPRLHRNVLRAGGCGAQPRPGSVRPLLHFPERGPGDILTNGKSRWGLPEGSGSSYAQGLAPKLQTGAPWVGSHAPGAVGRAPGAPGRPRQATRSQVGLHWPLVAERSLCPAAAGDGRCLPLSLHQHIESCPGAGGGQGNRTQSKGARTHRQGGPWGPAPPHRALGALCRVRGTAPLHPWQRGSECTA